MEVVTFVAGLATGLITWWISERRARQAPYRSKLEGFLLPLQHRLQLSELIADDLRGQLAVLRRPSSGDLLCKSPGQRPQENSTGASASIDSTN